MAVTEALAERIADFLDRVPGRRSLPLSKGEQRLLTRFSGTRPAFGGSLDKQMGREIAEGYKERLEKLVNNYAFACRLVSVGEVTVTVGGAIALGELLAACKPNITPAVVTPAPEKQTPSLGEPKPVLPSPVVPGEQGSASPVPTSTSESTATMPPRPPSTETLILQPSETETKIPEPTKTKSPPPPPPSPSPTSMPPTQTPQPPILTATPQEIQPSTVFCPEIPPGFWNPHGGPPEADIQTNPGWQFEYKYKLFVYGQIVSGRSTDKGIVAQIKFNLRGVGLREGEYLIPPGLTVFRIINGENTTDDAPRISVAEICNGDVVMITSTTSRDVLNPDVPGLHQLDGPVYVKRYRR